MENLYYKCKNCNEIKHISDFTIYDDCICLECFFEEFHNKYMERLRYKSYFDKILYYWKTWIKKYRIAKKNEPKKRCSMCKEWKPLRKFHKNCKYCISCNKKYRAKYKEKNKDKIRKRKKRYYIQNKSQISKQQKDYREKNKDKIRAYQKLYTKKRREKDPKFRLKNNLSSSISMSLKGNKHGSHWEKIVGYTLNDLIFHLEKQFTPKMNWDNYGTYWHIDHIIPIRAFNFSNYTHIDFKKCWALSNLRPLEAKYNISKGGKLNKAFQPSLKI